MNLSQQEEDREGDIRGHQSWGGMGNRRLNCVAFLAMGGIGVLFWLSQMSGLQQRSDGIWSTLKGLLWVLHREWPIWSEGGGTISQLGAFRAISVQDKCAGVWLHAIPVSWRLLLIRAFFKPKSWAVKSSWDLFWKSIWYLVQSWPHYLIGACWSALDACWMKKESFS